MDKEAAYTKEDGGTTTKHHTRKIDVAYEDKDEGGREGWRCKEDGGRRRHAMSYEDEDGDDEKMGETMEDSHDS